MLTLLKIILRMQFIDRLSPCPIAPHAQVGLRLMARETLKFTEARAILSNRRSRFRCHTLVGTGFDELADPEAARVTSRKLGRQRVIRADYFVAIGNIGFRPEK